MTGRKPIMLALQGGGAHGAFTWGVLDAILRSQRFEIKGVSGTSAGALNAAALAQALSEGGPNGAADRLRKLWKAVGERSPLQIVDAVPWPASAFVHPLIKVGFEAFRLAGQFISPYQPGLPSMNALADLVRDVIDVDRLRHSETPLFVSATNVRTGNLRIFSREAITVEALTASACLPTLFRAVEIDGEAYWDGGYTGNPCLKPLIELEGGCLDIVVLQVTPFVRQALPTDVPDIMNRIAEVTFNSALRRELDILTAVQDILRAVPSPPSMARRVADLRVHLIPAPTELGETNPASKLDTRPSRLAWLRELGEVAAERWLTSDESAAVGVRAEVKTRIGDPV